MGYGASPNECCELVRKACAVTLLGNHDAAVSGRMDYSFYYDAARHALDWTAARLAPDHLAWLRGLPYAHQAEGVGFSHGNPLDPQAFEYVFATEQAYELLPHLDAAARGQLHRPLPPLQGLRLHGDDEVHEVVATRFSAAPRLQVRGLGGLGGPAARLRQPGRLRDLRQRRAGWSSTTGCPYDVEASAQKIFDADLALNFGKRLFLGV